MSWQMTVGSWRLNRKARFVLIFITFASCLLPISSFAQSSSKKKKEQLQTQMKKLQEEIKLISAALKTTSAKKEKNMSEILSLQAKIKSRQKLIDNIGSQISDLDESIEQTQLDISTKSSEVEKMKADYAKLLQKSYENLTLQNQTAFMLSATSFYDAVRRYNYLLKIAEYRRAQAKSLQQSIDELEHKKEELQGVKNEKETLLLKQTAEQKQLETEKKQKDAVAASLQEKEKKLRQSQIEKNKAAQQLNNKIKAIIEEEIRLAKKKAEELARKKAATNTAAATTKNADAVIPLTPEEQVLSNSFSSNRGKLPWPVSRGHIISQFGKHEHPAIKGVMVENNGVDIKTEAGAEARAIFGGTVTSVFYLPTYHNCVMIKHGEFFTVYSNIETVTVKPNQKVEVKQSLGKLYNEKTESLTKVHLEIWKGKDKLDPELWLAN